MLSWHWQWQWQWQIAKLETWHWGVVIYNEIATWTAFAILAMFITTLSFLLALFSLFFHFQLFQSLVIWNSFVRINGTIWYLSIHVWTTLMLSQAKLDIWLPRVYRDDGDCAGDNFLERDHQHHCHDQHLAPECIPGLTHRTSSCSSHKSSFPPSSVE